MQTIKIDTGQHKSHIYIGESLTHVSKYIPHNSIVVITDKTVHKFYSKSFPKGLHIIINEGEKNKNIETITYIYNQLLINNIDRSYFILGIGGGIICDITGFVASTYMRGVPFGFVSTTLLSQVDASIGGKNGFNFKNHKNTIGVFSQPKFVICDLEMLKTLPTKIFYDGFAEIIKHAVIYSKELFKLLDDKANKALQYDFYTLKEILIFTLKIKTQIVEQDETEKGIRKILNFGHTTGHAIELTCGLSHGKSVSIGMVWEAKLSMELCSFSKDNFDKLVYLISKYNLPTKLDAPYNLSTIVKKIDHDKKRTKNNIHCLLLNTIGNIEIKSVNINKYKNKILEIIPNL